MAILAVVLVTPAVPAFAAPAPAHAQSGSGSKLTIVIHHVFENQPLRTPQSGLTTNSGEKISVTRLAYILSEPSLKPTNDATWLTNRAWFGFADAAKGDTTQVLSGLPARRFEQLRFCIGPDATTDHADPSVYPPEHPLNPLANGLHWGWAGGYVYLAIEGMLANKTESAGFSYHIAGETNRMTVNLPVALDLTHDTTVELDFHVDRAFAGEPPLRLADINSSHSRSGDEIAVAIKSRIENAFSVRSIHTTTQNAATLPAAAGKATPLIGTPYQFRVAKGFPLPQLPTDYPLTNERVSLGDKLFHDRRLSRINTLACATCHNRTAAFGDHREFSVGADGDLTDRNAMPLFNLAWKKEFFWDGRAPSVRKQAMEPIQKPNEMHESLDHVVTKLSTDPNYRKLFASAFGTTEITADRIGLALEAFVLTLTSFDSKFDRAMRGEGALTDEEKRGFQLFVSEYDPRRQQFGADCFHCHGGALFTDYTFHNNGLKLAATDIGRAGVTHADSDNGKFATPSLRNVALTAPYMHDGRFKTLEEVVDHYDHGVQSNPTLDPNIAKHPAAGLQLNAADKRALVAFLKTLTDEQFLTAEDSSPKVR
jgi:cytochrome c peroxidase